MKSRYSVVLAGFLLVFAFSAFAQEGENEGESEGEGGPEAKCRLTTTGDYTLPTPTLLRETLTRTYPSVSPLTPFFGVWVKVLEWNPTDKIEVIVDSVPRMTYNALVASPGWQLLPAVALSLAGSATVEVQSTTKTNVPNPSLILVGAIEFLDVASVVNPTEPNSLQDFSYSNDLNITGYTPPGIVTPDADMLPDVGPLLPLQTQVVVMGGITTVNPRLGIRWRYSEGVETEGEEGESEGENEGESEGEGEPGPFMPPSLELFWGDAMLHHTVLTVSGPPCSTVVASLNAMAGITAQPAVEISWGEGAVPGSRIILDDFSLSYAPESYEAQYPWLHRRYGNIIMNGDFESGTDPFVIESVGGYTGCPDIDAAVQEIGADACSDTHAVVFLQEEVLPVVPVVTSCSVEPEIVGKGETLRLTLTGENLQEIDEVQLVPQLGDSVGSYVLMEKNGEGSPTEVEYIYRFNGPLNFDQNGADLCTDGRISNLNYTELTSGAVKPVDGCGVLPLVDTIPPMLLVSNIEGTNAEAASPSVSAYRVLPNGTFPNFWAPQYDITPKNAASYTREDMRVYLKRNDYCPSEGDTETVYLNLVAQFRDPQPEGIPTPVEQAGFKSYSGSIDNLSIYPDVSDEGESEPSTSAGMVRWTSQPGIPTEALFTASPDTEAGGEILVADWQLQMQVSGNGVVNFKLEATDRAGNLLDTSQNNSIYLYWLCCPRAQMDGNSTTGAGVIDLPWSLGRGPLPGVLPACAPLAFFRVYAKNKATGALTLLGTTDWQAGPLRETTLVVGRPLRSVVDEILAGGNDICIDIIGADEAGNVQCRAEDLIQYEGDFSGTNPIDYISIQTERGGTKPRPDEAIDTAIRINLFHEFFDDDDETDDGYPPGVWSIRSYGAATRVALPPLAEACATRVNAGVRFRATLPAGSSGAGVPVLWKLYQEGALVARGLAQENGLEAPMDPNAVNGPTPYSLMGLLVSCNQGYSSVDLADYEGGTFVQESRSLDRNVYLAVPPSDAALLLNGYGLEPCAIPALGADIEFFRRLGDEGNPPNPENPNWPSERKREIQYTLTAQTVSPETGQIDLTPASVSFSIYVREAEDEVRGEAPIREFSR